VFWGSGEVFKENPKNWRGNFFEIATFFCEKRKCLEAVPLRGEKPRVTATSGHEFSILLQKVTEKSEIVLTRVFSSRLSANGLQSELGACRASAPACRDGSQESLPYNAGAFPSSIEAIAQGCFERGPKWNSRGQFLKLDGFKPSSFGQPRRK
jgi:hypothetical protein